MSLSNISNLGGDEAFAVRPRARDAGGSVRPRAPAADAPFAPALQQSGVSADKPRSRNAVGQAVRELVLESNQALQSVNQRLRFRVHDDTGQLMVQLVDFETGEVVRQQPPEEFLELAARIREMVGIFLDRTS